MTSTARDVADAMASYCSSRDVNGTQMPLFCKEHNISYEQYKVIVQAAKVPGQPKGLRSFITLHSDVLKYRMENNVLYVSKVIIDAPCADSISELTAKFKALHTGGKASTLKVLNDTLEPFKDEESISMRKFGTLMKEIGLCLANGNTYGTKLSQVLKKHQSLRVSKADAKEYPLVKKCLVVCH